MQQQEPKSKSAVKREHKAVQDFVRALIDTSDNQLKKLPLSESVIAEIVRARSMSKSALKRQIGFIAKNMADEPVDDARAALASLKQPLALANAHFHKLESWRDRLIAGDQDVLETLVHQYHADRQKVRQLVRSAQREAERDQPPRSFRQLFQYLRTITIDLESEQTERDSNGSAPTD
ncbi:MAG: ribosome biogenesis factor YjgA [Gammaproteobacteria bacterium]